MEKSTVFPRLNIGSGGFKLIGYIMGVMLILMAIMFVLLGEYWGLLIPLGFVGAFYGLIKIVEQEKVIFSEHEIIEKNLGFTIKKMAYSDIVDIRAFESGTTFMRPFEKKKTDGKVHVNFNNRVYVQESSLENISEHQPKHGFSFIVISSIEIPNHVLPASLQRNKKIILMHYRPEILDFLQQKDFLGLREYE
jgi:hypothetical protein